VLTAMGVESGVALGAVRLTLGRFSTTYEVDQAASRLVQAFRSM
jgi:cysteine desulfurase